MLARYSAGVWLGPKLIQRSVIRSSCRRGSAESWRDGEVELLASSLTAAKGTPVILVLNQYKCIGWPRPDGRKSRWPLGVGTTACVRLPATPKRPIKRAWPGRHCAQNENPREWQTSPMRVANLARSAHEMRVS